MPGEFEPHDGCWMLWPQRPDVWRNDAAPAQQAYCAVATAIVRFEPVTVCATREQYASARAMLPEHIRVVEMASDDAWIRDCGPTCIHLCLPHPQANRDERNLLSSVVCERSPSHSSISRFHAAQASRRSRTSRLVCRHSVRASSQINLRYVSNSSSSS
ncbi:MAG: agmatine deiminase family protein [Chloroflexota bacterium]